MDFKYIKDESEYNNARYLLRAYGERRGILLGTYDLIKANCLINKEYCLVEKKTEYYILSWDLDYKDNLDEYYRVNHESISKYIIDKINESIDDIIINGNKDYVYSECTKGLGKHIYYINIIVDMKLHIRIYDMVINKIDIEKRYDKKLLEKIIDRSVCEKNGIRLFGCEKEGSYYYPVKEKSTHKISGDIFIDFDYCLLNTEAKEYNNNIKIEFIKEEKVSVVNKNICNNLNEIRELLEIIGNLNKKYEDWIKVGLCLHGIDNKECMMELWYNWSLKNYDWESKQFNSIEEEIKYKWNSFKNDKDSKGIFILKKLAKEININMYIEWYNKYNKRDIVNLIKDFDQQTVSIYFKKQRPHDYIYKKCEWYILMENKLWRQLYKNENSKLINDITETIKGDLIELKNNLRPEDELLKIIPSVSKKLGTSKFILGVIDFLKEKYRNDNIEFDMKSNLFGFTKYFSTLSSINFSICFSTLSDNFIPSGPKSFSPLSV